MQYRLSLFLIYFYTPYLNVSTVWKKTALEYNKLPCGVAYKLGKMHRQCP